MKHRVFIAAVLLLLACSACSDEPISPEMAALEESEDTWFELKTTEGADYVYARTELADNGFGYSTSFRVIAGEVTERSYTAHDDGNNVTETWTETGADLGSHVTGHGVLVLDELYTICRTQVLTLDPTLGTLTLTFDAKGVVKECRYVGATTNGYAIEGLAFL